MRILMMMHMPWKREFGAARVQMELAEEFQALGHHVEKFDYQDAFPAKASCRLAERLRPQFFSSRAVAFVKSHGSRFDVIDANHGNLPLPKKALNFEGVLVARSNGLYAFYEEFDRTMPVSRNPPATNWKSHLHGAIATLARRRTGSYPLKSLQHADLITLLTDDEFKYVSENLHLGGKARVIPNGLSEQRHSSLRRCALPAAERLSAQTIVFIGAWGPRKGANDWGQIVRQVRQRCPSARFLFLGTGFGSDVVLRDLELPPSDWLKIVPEFASDDLPQLIANTTVGALPSYIEGFPISVLELMAAGIPVAAYDVPGPRAMLRRIGRPLLSPPGNAEAFAALLSSLLALPTLEYERLAADCQAIAQAFRWREIAAKTLACYQEAGSSLHRAPARTSQV